MKKNQKKIFIITLIVLFLLLLLFSLFSDQDFSDSKVRESEDSIREEGKSKNFLSNIVERRGSNNQLDDIGQWLCDLMGWCCNQACTN